MVRTGRLILVLVAVAFGLGCSESAPEQPLTVNPESLWSIERWKAEGADAVLIDVRKASDFLEGHLPGARQIWRDDLESTDYPYGGMAASREQLTRLMDSLGVKPGQQVVVYDGVGGCDAARLWWLLSLNGHVPVALLDGGPIAWTAGGNGLETKAPDAPAPSGFHFCCKPKTPLLATMRDVQNAASNGTTLLDTRSDDEYTGRRLKKGAARAGRIPMSLHYDWGNAVDLGGLGTMKSRQDLEWDLKQAGINFESPIITYCHSGVRSAHTTFVLTEVLGFTQVANYDGSWTEWSHMDQLPSASDVPVDSSL